MKLRTEVLSAFESLENQRSRLEEKLDQLDAQLLCIPEAEGQWSVNQVLTHLSNAEFGILRYIEKKMQGMDSLKDKNAWSMVRSVLLKGLLLSPLKYKMPKQLPEPSNELSYDQLKHQFTKNRQRIEALIKSFPEEALDKLIFRHPFAGRLSLYQTLIFMKDHYSHHLKQIDRILQAVE